LMGSDVPPERYQAPKGFAVTISVKQVREAERIFNELADGGTVTMPLQETFWATRFGMLTDRFGIPWMVNCEKAAAGAA
jgi:PhnB protein